jgi:hypothetical protein
MGQQRYDLRRKPDGTWTVFDVFAGLPVVEDGVPLVDMPMEEADDLLDLLNSRDKKRRGVT